MAGDVGHWSFERLASSCVATMSADRRDRFVLIGRVFRNSGSPLSAGSDPIEFDLGDSVVHPVVGEDGGCARTEVPLRLEREVPVHWPSG